jgi:hypothetical protein
VVSLGSAAREPSGSAPAGSALLELRERVEFLEEALQATEERLRVLEEKLLALEGFAAPPA